MEENAITYILNQRTKAESTKPVCPKCGENFQVQLIQYLTEPFNWKCRTCKTKFETRIATYT